MNRLTLTLSILSATGWFLGHSSPLESQVAVRGEKVYTMAGAPIEDGIVLIEAGKILAVGAASSVEIPSGTKVISAAIVTPGLIDARTVVGLSGYYNQSQDQDQLDRSAPLQPELRAIDAYNAREKLVSWVRSFGVTTLHTGPSPGAVISGQTMIVKTTGRGADRDVLDREAMIACTLGDLARARDGKSPGTRAKIVALLRAELIKAREYAAKLSAPKPADEEEQDHDEGETTGGDGDQGESGEKEKEKPRKPSRNLRLESLSRVLQGETPLLITAHRAHDIMAALRLKEEFEIDIILDGVAECHQVLDEIKSAGVPMILHPPMARARGELENMSMASPGTAHRAGLKFALQSGFESYVPKTRVLLFEAAIAVKYGLPFEAALAAVTIEAAKILGIENRVGSLEKGKDADLALYDGDPFEYTTHCIGVMIDGNMVSEEVR